MRRIDSPDERFHDANPLTGAQGTIVSADWLNSIQEELCYVLEQAGIDLNAASTHQLYAAIVAIIAAQDHGPVVVPTTPTIQVAPLIFIEDRCHWARWVSTAFYTGYRSLNVGDWYLGSMSPARPQEVSAAGDIYDIAAYPSLWGWAQERGFVVDAGDWEPRGTKYAAIGTTQFRVPDYRNMFPRVEGTDVDTANPAGPGVYQRDAIQNLTGSFGSRPAIVTSGGNPKTVFGQQGVFGEVSAQASAPIHAEPGTASAWNTTFDASKVARTSSETRSAGTRTAAVVMI